MAIEKHPHNRIPRNYVPPHTKPYKVKDGDSWETVAAALGMKAWDLIYMNFQTRDPAEVNWYLHHYVGCHRQTHDGKNWMFSSGANPGIIHVPPKTIVMPPLMIEGKIPFLSKVWAGLGKAHSGDLFVIGMHDLTGKVYNLGDEWPNVRNALININGFKFGPGLGADVSAVFILAHGYLTAREMIGVSGDWDFDISIGAKLGDFLKDVKGLGKVIDGIEKYQKMRYLAENAIKNRLIAEDGVYTIPIPFAGVGLHLWGGYKFGDVSVFGTGVGVP